MIADLKVCPTEGENLIDKVRYKKRIRLKYFNYRGAHRYFITICTNAKRHIFKDSSVVQRMVEILELVSNNFSFLVHAYCFMPDHLHLLVEGKDENADLKRFVKFYKQKTGYIYRKDYGNPLWQVNYYEHVLRKGEETEAVAKYIWGNPVRKGIVEDYRDYPYSGSLTLGNPKGLLAVTNLPPGINKNLVGQGFSLAIDDRRPEGLPYEGVIDDSRLEGLPYQRSPDEWV